MKEHLVPSRKTISNFIVPFPSIVTTRNREGIPNAITMSYLSAVHWDPPSVMLSISSKHKSNRNLEEHPKFTINILENDTLSIEIAKLAGTESGGGKLEQKKDIFLKTPPGINSKEWPPVINGAIIVLHGIIVKKIEYNGQNIFIGEIREAKLLDSLFSIDTTEKNLMWKAIDEMVMSNSDIYSQV